MNVTREEMIDILNKLAGELEAGLGENSYSVKIEVTGIALPVDQWPQRPPPPEPDLFDDERLREANTPSPPPRTGKRGGRKSH